MFFFRSRRSSSRAPRSVAGRSLELVGTCSPATAELHVRFVSGPGVNVVSDGRKLSRGQTLTSGTSRWECALAS